MTQILDALPTHHSSKILCRYHNRRPDLQIVRITNIPHWYFERVAFPNDLLLFEAVAGAILEIYRGDSGAMLLADHIPCERLQLATPTSSNVLRSIK